MKILIDTLVRDGFKLNDPAAGNRAASEPRQEPEASKPDQADKAPEPELPSNDSGPDEVMQDLEQDPPAAPLPTEVEVDPTAGNHQIGGLVGFDDDHDDFDDGSRSEVAESDNGEQNVGVCKKMIQPARNKGRLPTPPRWGCAGNVPCHVETLDDALVHMAHLNDIAHNTEAHLGCAATILGTFFSSSSSPALPSAAKEIPLFEAICKFFAKANPNRGLKQSKAAMRIFRNFVSDRPTSITVPLLEAMAGLCGFSEARKLLAQPDPPRRKSKSAPLQGDSVVAKVCKVLESYYQQQDEAGRLAALKFLDEVCVDWQCAKNFREHDEHFQTILSLVDGSKEQTLQVVYRAFGIISGTANQSSNARFKWISLGVIPLAVNYLEKCVVESAKPPSESYELVYRIMEAFATAFLVGDSAKSRIEDGDVLKRLAWCFDHVVVYDNKTKQHAEKVMEALDIGLEDGENSPRDGGSVSKKKTIEEPPTFDDNLPHPGRRFFSPLSEWYAPYADRIGRATKDVSKYYILAVIKFQDRQDPSIWHVRYEDFANIEPLFDKDDEAGDSLVNPPENLQPVKFPLEGSHYWDVLPEGKTHIATMEERNVLEFDAWPYAARIREEKGKLYERYNRTSGGLLSGRPLKKRRSPAGSEDDGNRGGPSRKSPKLD